MKQRGFAPILIVLLIALGVGGYFVYQNKEKANPQEFIFTFEECIKSKGSKITNSYPRLCDSMDGKTYIEKVDEPINTNSWTVVNTGLGFSLKCPPSWSCTPAKDKVNSAFVSSINYLRLALSLDLITKDNFQNSPLRHPNYKKPLDWFKDLEAKKEISLKVYPETIKQGRPGTDEKVPPEYYYFRFDQMSELLTKTGKTLIFPSDTSAVAIVPLNQSDLILVRGSALNTHPILKTILSSIEAN